MTASGSLVTSTTFWTAVGSIAIAVTAVVAVLAALFAYRQVKGLRDQLDVSVRQSRSQLYGQVSSLNGQIHDALERHTECIDYFYNQAPPPPTKGPMADPKLRLQLYNMCERYIDFVDGVIEQKRAMPATGRVESMDWSTWDSYFRFLYRSSPVLQEYVRENLDSYPDYIFAVLGYIIVREPESGRVTSKWVAHEVTDPDDADGDDNRLARRLFGERALDGTLTGFPWIRPWLFHPDAEAWDNDHGDVLPTAPAALTSVIAIVPGFAGRWRADVSVRWRGLVDAQAQEALRQWLCATLSAGERLTSARFVESVPGPERAREYELTRTVEPAEPSFQSRLHPMVEPRFRLPRSGGR
jgi:hypothetical protein